MPDVRFEVPEAIAGAQRDGNLMLRLRDRELGADTVAGFVARLAAGSERVVLAGYRKDWRPAGASAPTWAEALDACIEHTDGLDLIPPARADSAELSGFWRESSFFGERVETNRPRPQYRPGLVVIRMAPERLADFRCETWASPLLAFAADLGKRGKQGHFAPALALARRDMAAGCDKLSLLYQDPAWLTLIGAESALSAAIATLHRSMCEA